jgi:hypothetical protein
MTQKEYEDLKAMVQAYEIHGINFYINGASDHVPGSTLLIEWFRKK